ncbi:hypothetical protein JYT87_00470 [Nitrospira defluvii]|nr:hypothetical protein [Nitrospira defluvii]
MGLKVKILEDSFSLVAPRGKALVARFYKRLFSKYPDVKPLFRGVSIKAQEKKLLASLVLVIQNLKKPAVLSNALQELGARHLGYGAEPPHYDAVAENLLAVLEEFSGAAWTPRVKGAWTEALTAIKGIMLEGAKQAASAKKNGKSKTRTRSTTQTRGGRAMATATAKAKRKKKKGSLGIADLAKSGMDDVQTHIMICDRDLNIVYINKSSIKTLTAAEAKIQKEIPAFSVDKILGTNIDTYHKFPEKQRRLLADPENLPHIANIQIGPLQLVLRVSAIMHDGVYSGNIVEWEEVSAKRKAEAEMARLKTSLDNANTNIIICDRNYDIVYINKASVNALKTVEAEIQKVMPGFAVSKIVGSNIDTYHKNPAHQRNLLDNPKNLPHTAEIEIGPLKLVLIVSAIMSEAGEYLGNVVEWEEVTAKRKAEAEMARLKTSLDNANSNVIICDRDYTIVYVNKASIDALLPIEREIQKVLPSFAVNKIVGSNIDTYHKNPAHQRRILDDPKNMPHKAEIELGPLKLVLMVNAILSESGEYLGNVVEWEDVTAERLAQSEVERMIKGASEGVLTNRIDTSVFEEGFYKTLSEGINAMLESVMVPLDEAQKALGLLSEGDLRTQMVGDYQGTYDSMKQSLNAAVQKLSHTLSTVLSVSESVANGVNEISHGNDDLSQRTSEQASALEETSSSMEEMTSTVKQNADNAKQANQLAISARDVADKGREVTGKTNEAMAEVNKSSKKIVDIISVIDEIAFQTNLLALNAAVEAARAGEHGRGFAVVAAEVRNLAQRSATAAKEIKSLINESVTQVTDSTKLVNQSGETLEEIVSSVKKVTDVIGEITAASEEQTTGIEQVNKAIMQMDETTQQNAALVEEAASTSHSIKEQAEDLIEQVSFFKFEETEDDDVKRTRPERPARSARPREAARSRAAERPAREARTSREPAVALATKEGNGNGRSGSSEGFDEF